MTTALQPALIGLDWVTSSLRGYLLSAGGGVIDSIAKPCRVLGDSAAAGLWQVARAAGLVSDAQAKSRSHMHG